MTQFPVIMKRKLERTLSAGERKMESFIMEKSQILLRNVWNHWQKKNWRWHSRSGAPADNAVNRTVESIQKSNESAGSEVESGRREIEAAEEHVDRTVDAVERSEETAQSNARSADELQTLISECRGIIESQQSIIQEVDRANGIRTSGSKEN